MRNVFITGAYRSGTTLVEKLLHQHPDVTIASQPFPHLYFEVKAAFLRTLGREDAYPLGHLFLEDDYRVEDLTRFLRSFRVERRLLREAFRRVRGYSGHWTPELVEVVDDLPEGRLADVQSAMHELLVGRLGGEGAQVAGSKEIMCEEFASHLLEYGIPSVLVVRDPRAVISSLISGEGERYGGQARPLLFHLRNWRKSVAFALGLQETGVVTVRYEDVLEDAPGALAPVLTGLGLEGDGVGLEGTEIVDQRGERWGGNSSFTTSPSDATTQKQRFLDVLEPRTLAFIECCTYPEMLALGYPLHTECGVDMAGLDGFAEPVPVTRAEFPPDYSTNRTAREEERQRVRLLQDGSLSSDAARRWFVLERTAQGLSTALRTGETQVELPSPRQR